MTSLTSPKKSVQMRGERRIYIWRAGELRPVGVNVDDAVSAKRQGGTKQARSIRVCLVSVALPGTLERERERERCRERGFWAALALGVVVG